MANPTVEIPENIRKAAAALGVDVEALISQLGADPSVLSGGQPSAEQSAAPAAADPAAAAAAAVSGGVPGVGVTAQNQHEQQSGSEQVPPPPAAPQGDIPATTDPSVTATPGGETPEQQLQRENAVLQQQLQQTRSQLQNVQDARVIGSSGLSGPVESTPPNLGSIEPGIRFAVRNGLISAETLRDKFGPIIVELFENDMGGVI